MAARSSSCGGGGGGGGGGDASATLKLWGGRFEGGIDPHMERFNASISFDKRMADADVRGSIAYAKALGRAGVLTEEETGAIVGGLEKVRAEWSTGSFDIKSGDEDIHTANERRLTELIGSVAGKLHTGRSRNDQAVTDVRLWLRDSLGELVSQTRRLVAVTAARAEEEVDIIMPGYTHLQRAQPVRWSHWLLSHAVAWRRDVERMEAAAKHVNVLALGSGALAGHPFGLDREWLAGELGFSAPSTNSLDAVAGRDYIIETVFSAAMLGNALSRFAEDLILYSSAEFGFVRISDLYSTGSSLMPQKRNPDALELLRGKAGRSFGALATLMMVTKGMPTAYNKDLQEDKEPLFDCMDTVTACVEIATGVTSTLEPQPAGMRAALSEDMLATDLADYLVRKGIPFRQTHHIAGSVVALAERKGVTMSRLSLEELRDVCSEFDEDVEQVWDYEASVEKRDVTGGTARAAVLRTAAELRVWAGGDLAAV